MSNLEAFEKEVNEKGLYFFKKNSLDLELYTYDWDEILYISNFKKYAIHNWLKEYKHDNLFDYSILLHEDYETKNEKFENYPDYVKEFAYRVEKFIRETDNNTLNDVNNLKIDNDTKNIVCEDKFKIVLENYDIISKVFAKLGVKNLPNKKKVEELCDEFDKIKDNIAVKDLFERADQLSSDYSSGENKDFDKFFFMSPQMKNVSASSYYYENSDGTIDTGRTVTFNDEYSFYISHQGYRDANVKIKLKTLNNYKTYISATIEYVNQIKEIMDLFGFDKKDVKIFNKYLIYFFCTDCSDEVWYDNIYDLFNIKR